jgi:hypothetical protein
MAANGGMVAGSHNRNEFVTIRHDGDAPAPVSLSLYVPSGTVRRSASLSVPFLFVAAGSCCSRERARVSADLVRRWI